MQVRLFDKTIQLLEKALDLRSDRHRAIAANIANQDTPGYRAAELNFKEAVQQASGASAPLSPVRTDPRHLPAHPVGGSVVPSSPPPSFGSPASSVERPSRLDGNTVVTEREMAKLAENTLMYNATVQLIAKKFAALKSALREGR